MGMLYPCQVGLPEDLDPAIKGIIFLCCDFHIIPQEHDGVEGVRHMRSTFSPDPLTVWAATVDRGSDCFEMCVLAHEDWLELRIRLFANGSDQTFLQIIFRQPREKRGRRSKSRPVSDCGWSFTSMQESDVYLREWVKENWPALYREHLDVIYLRGVVPQHEQLRADSSFMSQLIGDLFGWFSRRRAA